MLAWLMWKNLRPLIWFVQRARTGVSQADAWNLYRYTERTLAVGLRRLAGDLHGCPAEYVIDDTVDEGCERWKAELLHVADDLESLEYPDSRADLFEDIDEDAQVRREAWAWLMAHWESLWD